MTSLDTGSRELILVSMHSSASLRARMHSSPVLLVCEKNFGGEAPNNIAILDTVLSQPPFSDSKIPHIAIKLAITMGTSDTNKRT